MEVLIRLTILSGILGQLVKFPLGAGHLYPLDGLVFLSASFWLWLKIVKADLNFRLPGYFFPLFLFWLWALLTLAIGGASLTGEEFLSGGFYLLRFAFYSLFSLAVYDWVGPSQENRGKIVISLITSASVVAVAGFVQLIIYPDLSRLASEFGYDPHKNRLVSTFLDPNFIGAYLVLGLVLLIGFWKSPEFSNATLLHSNVVKSVAITTLQCVVVMTVGLVLLLGLVLTFSRSGWLMLTVSLLVYGLLKSRKIVVLSLLFFVLAYALVPRIQTRLSGITDPDDSAKLRLVSWSRAWEIFSENPIFGVGFNLYRPAQERFGFFDPSKKDDLAGGHAGAGSDSSLLLILATTGVPGFFLFGILMIWLLIGSLRRIRSPEGLALFLSLIGLLVESQFINSLFYPAIMLWLWTLVGLL